MGRGGYLGASTIVFPASKKWQSEDFYALPLDPHWKQKVLKEKQKADAQAGVKKGLPIEAYLRWGSAPARNHGAESRNFRGDERTAGGKMPLSKKCGYS